MKVLVLSNVFPNVAQPVHGLFVYRRIEHAAAHADIRVVAPVSWRTAGWRQVPLVERRGRLEVHHPPFWYVPGPFSWTAGYGLYLSSLAAVNRLRSNFNFDLVDAQFGFPAGVAGALLARRFRRPLVITLRGTEIDFLAYPARTRATQKALAAAARIIVVSEQLKRYAESLGTQSDRIVVIPNGVDTAVFYPVDRMEARRRVGVSGGGPLIVSAGHLVPRKGFERLLRAIPGLLPAYPELSVAIVGGPVQESGRYSRDLHSRSVTLGLKGRVLFPGAQSVESMRDWMNAADVFVLSSSREGCPNVVLEAEACGTPVVCSRTGETERLVTGESGIIYGRPDDEEGLRAALREALNRQWDRDAIRCVVKAWDWGTVACKVAGVWRAASAR